jgi:hypothetical protein
MRKCPFFAFALAALSHSSLLRKPPCVVIRALTRVAFFRPELNSPGSLEMWPETATHECWGACANSCVKHKDVATLPSECTVLTHDLVFHKRSVAGVANTYTLWDTQRAAEKMCITGALDAASGRARAEMRACTGAASEQWRIDPVEGTLSTVVHTALGDERLCLTAPSTTVVIDVDNENLRGECESPQFRD